MAKITNVILLEQPEQPAIIISEVLPMNEMADFIDKSFYKLSDYLNSLGEIPSDVPFVAYHNWKNMYSRDIKVTIGLPIVRELPPANGIESVIIPSRKNVVSFYRGGYKSMDVVYAEMEKWAAENGIALTPDCFEFYYNGPEFEEEDFLTKVHFPVK